MSSTYQAWHRIELYFMSCLITESSISIRKIFTTEFNIGDPQLLICLIVYKIICFDRNVANFMQRYGTHYIPRNLLFVVRMLCLNITRSLYRSV